MTRVSWNRNLECSTIRSNHSGLDLAGTSLCNRFLSVRRIQVNYVNLEIGINFMTLDPLSPVIRA